MIKDKESTLVVSQKITIWMTNFPKDCYFIIIRDCFIIIVQIFWRKFQFFVLWMKIIYIGHIYPKY